MTLDEAKSNLKKAQEAYENSLSPIKEYDTPGGSTLKKHSPSVLLKQVEYWQKQVRVLTLKSKNPENRSGGVTFRDGVID